MLTRALLLLVMTSLLPQSGNLSQQERALTAFVDANNESALALLERVVNINSGTQNFDGVRDVGAVFRAEFDALGFKTEWIDGTPFQRAGHLVAEHPGTGPRILLIGHLDTVFEPDSPFQKFERVSPTAAKGPGITDMKGGDVIIVQSLKALKSVGLLDTMNIVVVMTGDEEAAGRPLTMSRAALVKAAQGADVAIGFEDGDGNPATAVIARRGTSGWELRVTGKPAHSSQIFNEENGYGAVFETARILNGFREALAGQPHLTFNPGVVLGGTSVDYDAAASRGTGFGKSNVIAEHAVATGDLRALSLEQFAAAKRTMQEIVAASLPQTSATITFDDGYPPLAPTPGNERLLTMFHRASVDVGAGDVVAVDPDKAGAADVSFVAGHAGMILDGVGLMGTGGHTVDEVADLRTLPAQAKRMAVLLARLQRGEAR
ncbi:MAG: M20/M25/M40 family metallo-hydrolase [Acidobacteria bacterium]|jgi:glutamate carboxypeptidase|nr:M20/M25/M40 family metallo-hydrolase [Acidobacteriota bacterium]